MSPRSNEAEGAVSGRDVRIHSPGGMKGGDAQSMGLALFLDSDEAHHLYEPHLETASCPR